MSMLLLVGRLGNRALAGLAGLGQAAVFFGGMVRAFPKGLKRFDLVITQVHAIGNRSVVIIVASGATVGLVLALQGYFTLSRYGSAEQLGLLVALALLREMGPVLAALLFAGRAGTSLTAEIGLMKAGEQLVAMEMMAVDPVVRVLVPRLLGGIIAMPLLAAMFSAVGILAAYVEGVHLIGLDPGSFWSAMQNGVDVIRDLGAGVVKSVVFGVAATFIAVYTGYESRATPEGVALATTRTVVVSSLVVLALDFVLTALMFSTQ
jgi:phospholipid/cholesterol/gamma-HCH transport system permease protein